MSYPFKFKSPQDEQTFADVLAGKHHPTFDAPGLVVISSNGPWTGKTTAARLLIQSLFNIDHSAGASYPKNENVLSKVLRAAAERRTPYVFFDNVYGYVESEILTKFLSCNYWRSTSSESLEKPSFEQAHLSPLVIFTSNGLSLSLDLAARARFIELGDHDPDFHPEPS